MKRVILLLCVVSFFGSIHAQTNPANIRVDDLTDAQIEQYVKRAELMGYSESQLDGFARAQGVSAVEAQKLKDRLQKIKRNKQQPNQLKDKQNNTSSASGRQINGTIQSDSLKNKKKDQDSLKIDEDKLKIFGSDLFKNGEITFEPNLRMATPSSYIIGPDDEILLDITGDNEASYQLPVSPDGTITVEYVGKVAVSGLSIAAAKSKIQQRLSGTYPAIRSGQTQVDVNIGNIRSIRITLTGAVTKPGTYTLPSLATVFNALYASGGPSEKGTYRQIQVVRNNQVVTTIDLYDFLANGIQRGNIRLQDQDIIHIPVYGSRVQFEGEVKRPAIFETVAGESLLDLVKYAGGFSENAYTAKVKVLQKTDRERSVKDIYSDQFADYSPKAGDQFIVEPILERFANRVSILGAVFRPGLYGMEPGMTLKQLLEQADGVREDAFLERGIINRLRADNTAELINFNVQEVLAGTTADIPLKREDKIEIASIFDLRDEYKFTVQGEVRFPGDFPFASNATLGDLIQKAGGLNESAKNARIEIARRLENRNVSDSNSSQTVLLKIDQGIISNPNIELQPYDVITVLGDAGFRTQRQVKIEGEVLFPGIYTISREDERISDIIKRAGGLTSYAYTDGASLKRTGLSKLQAEEKKEKENSQQEIAIISGEKRIEENNFEQEITLANPNAKNKALAKLSQQQGVSAPDIEPSDLVGIELSKILTNPKQRGDLLVLDGDIITVPKELETVKVMGEVLNPNNVVYVKGKNLKYYVNQAGGFTDNALKKRVFVQYANGSVKGKDGGYPEVKPGAEIVVPKRAPRERLSSQAWVSIGAGVASTLAIILSLFR
ncbi:MULTISPECIES: SLBB domain-containing protein [Sphingobacterium]|uniref:SLBB domain-containing protein n=1 Tax=Sphingobacterium TaxID=28453 RepID=UPI0010500BD4|nr:MULTISPECIES: SLBB domain-containing protein [Sphingobacterium]MCW2262014.1 protein involved in polysaccharide export with SLBB domain [Sphingobacterium kitahiroshimense]TCR13238.1 protein involved in polysaccharide export with SLBB domain [Sphingobacterium sp. JUb78]